MEIDKAFITNVSTCIYCGQIKIEEREYEKEDTNDSRVTDEWLIPEMMDHFFSIQSSPADISLIKHSGTRPAFNFPRVMIYTHNLLLLPSLRCII